MKVFSITEARNNFKEIFDSAYLDNEEVIVHRKDRESVVIISLDEWNSLKETKYLLSNPNNAKHLANSIKQLNSNEIIEKDIID